MNISRLFLLLAVVLVASSSSEHSSVLFNGESVVGFQISGCVSCSLIGNPTSGVQLLSGAHVFVTCNRSPTILGQATTDSNGAFLILVTNLQGIALVASSPLPCFAAIGLPVQGCTALPSTSLIRAQVVLGSSTVRLGVGQAAVATIENWLLASPPPSTTHPEAAVSSP